MGSPLSRWRKPGRLRRDLEGLGLFAVIAVSSALFLLPRGDDGLLGFPELAPGDVAPRTVKSPRSFSTLDPRSTEESRERARDAVPEVFDHLLGLSGGATARLEVAFGAAAQAPSSQAAARFVQSLGVDLDPAAVEPLVAGPDGEELLDAASMLVEASFAQRLVHDPDRLASQGRVTIRSVDADGTVVTETVEEADALGPNQARTAVDRRSAERLAHLPPPQRRALARVVKSLLTPNLVPNVQETLRRRRVAWMSVKPSMLVVARGDRIVRGGERVTERDLLLLEALALLESPSARLRAALGSGWLGLVLAGLGLLAVRYGYRHRLLRPQDRVFLASAFIAFLLLVFIGFKGVSWLAEVRPLEGVPTDTYRLVMPLATVPIVLRLAAGPVVALAAAPVFGLVAGWMMDGDLGFSAYALAGSLAAGATDPGRRRMVASAGLAAAVAQAAVALGHALVGPGLDPTGALALVAAAAVSGATSAVLARAMLPAVENLFGYTTPTGLAAFADPEHPLLRELLVEVPGTYHHGQQVGALAEAGARAVGADRLLARVGGSLHDVGRLGGPGTPEERRRHAARIAGQHRMPPELARVMAEQPLEAGRGALLDGRARPRGKSSALVFLADWVERALAGEEGRLGGEALRQRVQGAMRDALARGLLDSAALELRELAAVEAAFVEALWPRFVHENRSAFSRPPSFPERPS